MFKSIKKKLHEKNLFVNKLSNNPKRVSFKIHKNKKEELLAKNTKINNLLIRYEISSDIPNIRETCR